MLLSLATFLLQVSAIPNNPAARADSAESTTLSAGPIAREEARPVPRATEPRAASGTKLRDREPLLINAAILPRGEFARLLSDPPASAPGSPEAAPLATISNLSAPGKLHRAVALPSAKASPFLVAPSNLRERRAWYGLTFATHSAAAFDAWTTRRVIGNGFGHETNPLLKPFASSDGLYAAVQVGPAVFDYVGHRLMTTKHRWLHRMWWVPQLASTGVSLWAGAHNLQVYRQGRSAGPR